MTDERDRSSRAGESSARNTARDAPFVRGAGSESEPAPRAQRPVQLPRDPSYEAELQQVDLAVLRDRTDPSTKQGGRGHRLAPGQPPESVTPESPGTRAARDVAEGRSPEPPGSGGRAVASGTLLSVGAVDPRGKTERTLETPRLFFSQPQAGTEAYFKPAAPPAVTVHQTLETETVKLSDSIDPRRAKTIPRMDRVVFPGPAGAPESDAPHAVSRPQSSLAVQPSDTSARWNQAEYEAASLPSDPDGQIHASLSPFRDQAEPSFNYDGVPTRPEPLAGRRSSEPPEESVPALPDPNTIPTQRDLPQHRVEASQPPPPPASGAAAPGAADEVGPNSEARPTTASIIVEEPAQRPAWINYAAFVAALLVAVVVGLLLTRNQGREQAPARVTPPVEAKPVPQRAAIAPDAPTPPPPAPAPAPAAKVAPTPVEAAPAPKSIPAPAVAEPAAPRKTTPNKASRETIF